MSHDEWLTDAEAEREAEGEQLPRPGDWAWATEYEAPQWASTVQLVSWLARAELPPHTLVWKPGWAEWLPALQVAELADAFPRLSPGRRRVARAAFESAAAPPPVPVAQYPHIRLQTKDALRESSAAQPVLVARGFAPTEYVLVKYRDGDLAQQVTKQVPAADMLEAALAMGAPRAARRSDSRRWSAEARAEASLPPPTLPPPTLPPLAVELSVPPPSSRKAARDQRESSGFGPWIWFGSLAGALLGVLSVVSVWPTPELSSLSVSLPAALLRDAQPAPPPAAEPTRELNPQPSIVQQAVPAPQSKLVQQQLAMRPAPSEPSVPPVAAQPGRVRVKRSGEPALLNALRVTKNADFDRVVFEFRERVPGYRIEYVNRPARDCESGQVRRVDGKGRLELQLFPAQAHAEDGEPAFRARELKPALSVVRELERTCDRNGVVTWVVGTNAVNRYRAYELSAPPRLVVQIDH
ncbi:MAG: hypothetical protein RL033_2237 [Pseudomonadota bacterium]